MGSPLRRRTSFALALALSVAAAAASTVGAAAPLTPGQLTQKLRSTAYRATELPHGFSSAKLSTTPLSAQAKKDHAVGEVQVDLNGPDAADGLFYEVFPAAADADDDLDHPNLGATGSAATVEGHVPGYSSSSRWIDGSVTVKNPGTTITDGVTGLFVAEDNVIVGVFDVSTANPKNGNMAHALALLRSGIAHLGTVRGA